MGSKEFNSYSFNHSVFHQICNDRGPLLTRAHMETMLEALNADGCAGSYFTTFCEQSGNQVYSSIVHVTFGVCPSVKQLHLCLYKNVIG